MSRGVFKIEPGGFPVYAKRNLPKINAIRRAISQPDYDSPIVPTKGQALFTTAEEMNDEPASCANCQFYNQKAETCALIGPRIPIRKFTYPKESTGDSKPIEYWPCCSMQLYGSGNNGDAVYRAQSDPDYLDLVWINAARPGQDFGGANCGGCDGGDDCDHYITEGKEEKWESATGFCRALQTTVACGDVCSLWQDDDEIRWREAVKIIREQNGTS
jgi:hypothetical protein